MFVQRLLYFPLHLPAIMPECFASALLHLPIRLREACLGLDWEKSERLPARPRPRRRGKGRVTTAADWRIWAIAVAAGKPGD